MGLKEWEGKPGSPRGLLTPPLLPASGASIPPVRIESSSPSVTEGQTLDLNCMVTGLAHSQITWYKRGGSLPPHAQVRGSLSPWQGTWGWSFTQPGTLHSARAGSALISLPLQLPMWGGSEQRQALRHRGSADRGLSPSSHASFLTWPRYMAPGCGCPTSHQLILENTCAEWRMSQAPRRPPSSSPSSTAAIRALATPQVRSQWGWVGAEPSNLPSVPKAGVCGLFDAIRTRRGAPGRLQPSTPCKER